MRLLRSLKSKFKNQNAKFRYSDEVGMIFKFYIVILHFDVCIFHLNFNDALNKTPCSVP